MSATPNPSADPARQPTGDVDVTKENETAKLPLLEDVMQLARIGDIQAMKNLFESGKTRADHKDNEGITPLHWAAINNHYAMSRFLIESGADVNAKGGEAVATPAMWAAQRCNYYVVNLLLKHGADPLLTDAQGYNILHLATFDGNVFLLILLLHQNIAIDTPDLQGHTCLMWAAYKGYPACVDLFLRWGASVALKDENGFTALHWALVKGSQGCIQKLLEYGADRFVETSDGKTPSTIATEMKSQRVWEKALNECGYQANGHSKQFPLPFPALTQRHILSKALFLQPFALILLVIGILSTCSIFLALPLSVGLILGAQRGTMYVLEFAPSDMKHIHKTPYLSGVFAGTLFWVGLQWLVTILPNTFSTHPMLNLLFGVLYGLCTWFYTLCMTEDPGYVPRAGSRSQEKAVIEELLSLWNFDDQNFCEKCMVRRPLRSKHCSKCKRCVAKLDHHCPWIHNCVAANNLRQFVLYVTTLELGILAFLRLVFYHLEVLPAPEVRTCKILSEDLCGVILRDPFTVILALWAALQLTWVTMLIIVQWIQVARATTTWEAMRGHGNHGGGMSETLTAAVTAGTTSLDAAQLPQGHAHSHGHRHKQGCFDSWKKLLGLDTFLATAQSATDSNRRSSNPYSRGVLTNCKDFWCDPQPLFKKRENGSGMLGGDVVNYARMYESPPRMRRSGGIRGDNAQAELGTYTSVGSEEV